MKKFLLTIIFLINLSILPLAFASSLDNSTQNQDLQTRIFLDNNYKPANSPGITFTPDAQKALKDGTGNEAIFSNFILQMLAGALISVAAPVAVIIIAIAGFMAVSARGNQAQLDKAKQTLTHAIIGLLIIIFSWVIVKAVISAVLSTNSSQPGTTQGGAAAPATPANGGVAGGGSAAAPCVPSAGKTC